MLLSSERQLLAHFVLQARFERLAILAAARADPQTSGPLIHAYEWISANT